MTSKELQKKVADLIDQHCMELTLEEYIDAMEAVSQDAEDRAASSRSDLQERG